MAKNQLDRVYIGSTGDALFVYEKYVKVGAKRVKLEYGTVVEGFCNPIYNHETGKRLTHGFMLKPGIAMVLGGATLVHYYPTNNSSNADAKGFTVPGLAFDNAYGHGCLIGDIDGLIGGQFTKLTWDISFEDAAKSFGRYAGCDVTLKPKKVKV